MHLYDLLPGLVTTGSKILIGYPFETIKTRVQVNKTTYTQELQYYKLRPFKLYKGCTLPLIASSFKRSVQFSIFEELNKYYPPLIGGMSGGALSAAVTNPITVVRNNVQGLHKYNNTIECVREIYKEQGLTGLNRGFKINLVRDTLFCGVFLGSYGCLRNNFPNESFYHGIAGISSSFITWITLIPFDTYRTMIQVGNHTSKDVNNMILNKPLILWNGLPMMLLRSCPVNIVSMVLYEKVRNII